MLRLTTGGVWRPSSPAETADGDSARAGLSLGKSRAGNNLTIIKAYKPCQAAVRPNGLQPISYDINGIGAS